MFSLIPAASVFTNFLSYTAFLLSRMLIQLFNKFPYKFKPDDFLKIKEISVKVEFQADGGDR